MGKLGAIHEDVGFDWAGAQRLSAELRNTAGLLEGQIPHRNAIAQSAKSEWRGVFSEEFINNRMKICSGNAVQFAAAMRQAAQDLDALAEVARREQNRREQAREWEAEQQSENVAEKVFELVTGTDEQPFGEAEIFPPSIQVRNPAAGARA
jgi:hypothetical protein